MVVDSLFVCFIVHLFVCLNVHLLVPCERMEIKMAGLKSADPKVVGRGKANFVDQRNAFVRLSTWETREKKLLLGSF